MRYYFLFFTSNSINLLTKEIQNYSKDRRDKYIITLAYIFRN